MIPWKQSTQALDVAQLVQMLLQTPEVCSLNPVTIKLHITNIVNCIEKAGKKETRKLESCLSQPQLHKLRDEKIPRVYS